MNICNGYLWLVGENIGNYQASELIKNRYEVISRGTCQDRQPEQSPFLTGKIPRLIAPYFKLFDYRLHLPIVYDFFSFENKQILVLENVPFNSNGELYPRLNDVWLEAEPLQQIYWLWQILELWQPLKQEGVAQSLLIANNVRVDGWRIRLVELIKGKNISLKDLGTSWDNLAILAGNGLSNKLEFVVSELKQEAYSLAIIQEILNELLIKEATNKPWRTKIFSVTDKGKKRDHNEDYYYPTELDLYILPINYNLNLANNLMIVCDGMGGHENGELASYLAIESLKVQMKMFLTEMAKNYEILTPAMVKESLATILRVTNNLIYSRNQSEGKSDKSSMGTTLIMALQLPQIALSGNTHEVYLANVGDSRAYWITTNSCQQLTVDHDLATKNVKIGKNIYRQALQNPFSGKLTQALGIRDSFYLEPTIQRFIIVEDGVLLLCSDGLSDYNFLENNWSNFIHDVLEGRISLQNAMQSLLKLAIEKNGHDNITIVATFYGVSPQESVVVNFGDLDNTPLVHDIPDASALVLGASSMMREQPEFLKAELEDEVIPESDDFDGKWLLLILLAVLIGFSSYVITQWKLEPRFNPPLINDVNMQK